MKVGFETIGNAILIGYDQKPVFCTDPWFRGDAYFESWTLQYEIPEPQLRAIKECEFVWLSHGHPDHLSGKSLLELQGKKILLPDHAGGRVFEGLMKKGFKPQILKDREWYTLSPQIQILSIADYNQDAVLLARINGRLVVNINDASDRGWKPFVRSIIKSHEKNFLLSLVGYGDTSLKIENISPAPKPDLGKEIADLCHAFGARYFIPFSSLHIHQRSDSLWANESVPALEDYAKGFESQTAEILPAFLSYDCETDKFFSLNPPKRQRKILNPSEIGDSLEETLDAGEVRELTAYLRKMEHLKGFLDYVNFRVGNKDNIIELSTRNFKAGLIVKAPRNSLMTSVRYEIFDDLVIGNFASFIVQGNWKGKDFANDFVAYITKYADNGHAYTREELKRYFEEYRKRAPVHFFIHQLTRQSKKTLKTYIPRDSAVLSAVRRMYHFVEKAKS